MEKLKISMVKYDELGKPLGVALGEYKLEDVDMFRQGGYVDVVEKVAKEADSYLVKLVQEGMFPI